jgi:hypothetical protein
MRGLSRRGFLGVGGATLAAAGAGYFWVTGSDAGYARMASGAKPSLLSIMEYAVLDALATAIIHPINGAPDAKKALTALRIDRELSLHHDSSLSTDMKASLGLLEHAPLLDGLGPRFTDLSASAKQTFLANCMNAEPGLRRAAYNGVRFLIVFFYYTDDRAWPGIGYGGPFVDEKIFEGGNRIANLSSVKADLEGVVQ